MKNWTLMFGVAAVAALALACSEQAASPVAPTAAPAAAASQTGAASAGGSTLKASAPAPQQPSDESVADSLTPTLVVANATLTYLGGSPLAGSLWYRFVVETAGGVPVYDVLTGSGEADTGSIVAEDALQPSTAYRWRARAEMGGAVGPWSGYWSFTTPAPKPRIVWPTTPEAVVAFAVENYPDYLHATSSLHQREVNMAFIRDRMIEAGICGGLDLARNLKRGVGPHSTDALLFRDGRRDRVIDIAAGFDEYRVPLRLHWIQVEGPPGYDRYLPRPVCQ